MKDLFMFFLTILFVVFIPYMIYKSIKTLRWRKRIKKGDICYHGLWTRCRIIDIQKIEFEFTDKTEVLIEYYQSGFRCVEWVDLGKLYM